MLNQAAIKLFVESGIQKFLSGKAKKVGEKTILTIAILSYVIHLLLIALVNWNWIETDLKFLNNPVSAIYTPFSFILVYEVYLLLYYLPQSTSFYIGKQYEIITLIVIRRIFKDIGNLEFVNNWFSNPNDMQFTIDTLTSLLLFLLIYWYYYSIFKRAKSKNIKKDFGSDYAQRFLYLKRVLALTLVPILFIMALFSLFNWISEFPENGAAGLKTLAKVNNVFFDEFFTVLIIVDVLLLITSFYYSDKFHTIIRNSGFVISTVLLKLSFSTTGIINNVLIIGSVLFGILILQVHDLFERLNNKKINPT
jgi:hypothetical protein